MASRSENQDKQRTSTSAGAKSPAKPAGRGAAKSVDGGGRAAKGSSAARSGAKAAPTPRRGSTNRSAAKGPRAEVRDKASTKAVKTEDKPAERSDGSGTGVNREMKRMMQRREGAADRLRKPTVQRAKRTKPIAFLKEVRGELGRVAWPTRPEVITYSLVVVVTVTFFMVVIYGIDYVALKGVLFLIDRGGR
jgi:preprotein translocase subunit SecE